MKRILVISLSNIGDVILTTPVWSCLRDTYPDADIDLLVGPRAVDIASADPRISQVFIYNRRAGWRSLGLLVQQLRSRQYDLAVDLRQSLFPWFAGAKRRTPLFRRPPQTITPVRQRHVWWLSAIGLDVPEQPALSLPLTPSVREQARQLLEDAGWRGGRLVVMVPGARSPIKRWVASGYAGVGDRVMSEMDAQVALVGSPDDMPVSKHVQDAMQHPTMNLTGSTSLVDLAGILEQAELVVTNDSAPLHMAVAVGTTVVAVFGPTDANRYGPWPHEGESVRVNIHCSPCEMPRCQYQLECMHELHVNDVFAAVQRQLKRSAKTRTARSTVDGPQSTTAA